MGLIAHWKLNNDCTDATGNGNDGTPTAISHVAGKIGQGADFNGGTSQISVPLTHDAGSRSFCVWCYTTNNQGLYRTFLDSQTGRVIFSWRGTASCAVLAYYDNGSWRTFGSTPEDSTAHHVAFVCDAVAGTVTCYLDGVISGSPQTYTSTAIGGAVMLGHRHTGDTATFLGWLDDIRLYNEALSLNQVRAIWASGRGTEVALPWAAARRRRLLLRAA